MIEMSVRMPLFRARYIAWLALESLCRQKRVTFKWELVIAEEQDCSVETDLLQSREVGPAIVDEAIERGVDLITIGLEYEKKFGEFNLGDTVPYVLKNAPCWVVICREPIPEEDR